MSEPDRRSETADDAVEDTDPDFSESIRWRAGIISGAIASVSMGLVIMVMDFELLRTTIAVLYGQEESLIIGWIAHLVHGSLFGLLFAVLLSEPNLARLYQRMWKIVAAGIVYGVVLTVVAAGIIMPIWLGAVEYPRAPSIPNITVTSLIWHVVYGIVLGVVFSLITK